MRPFVLYEARTASRADALDETGKVVLPAQQLTALAMATGGELPPTLLLRISHAEAAVHVGVAEFADDAPLSALIDWACVEVCDSGAAASMWKLASQYPPIKLTFSPDGTCEDDMRQQTMKSAGLSPSASLTLAAC